MECVVQTTALLDYEASASHNLTVRAQDPFTGGHTDTHVTVAVTDVNDNPPEFSRSVFKGGVSEAASPGHVVLQVSASDVDTGPGGSVRYSCVMECGSFEVRALDGAVTLAKELHAETEAQHVLTVLATDSGIPQLSSTATVVIDVVDFNDNPPAWRQDSYSCRVSAEAQPGHVVTSVSATDPDAGQVTPLSYAIHSGDRDAIFRMDQLTAQQVLQRDYYTTYRNLDFTAVFREFNRTLYEAYVEENSSPGQLVINLVATDLDASDLGKLQYTILHQTSEGAFTVDKEGNLYTETPLDRESLPMHSLNVSVMDEGPGQLTAVRVTVRDKNDYPPVFMLLEYQANINTDVAPRTTILKVEASDVDEGANSEVRYRMYEANSSEALELFSVNPTTGEVTVAQTIHSRENEVYQFFIRGEDSGSPQHHSDVPVTIFLLPPHENPPHCARKYAQFFIREDAPIGNVITSLWMAGPQSVQYLIMVDEGMKAASEERESGESSGPFTVTSTGLVVVHRALDHERRRTHHISVTNRTLTTPPTVDYMTISVVVMDVNDCPPRFSESSYTALVAENSEVGATVTILTAADDDEGNHGQVNVACVSMLFSVHENILQNKLLNVCSALCSSLLRSSTASDPMNAR
ncbi:protocadherin Fat 3-like [Eriocheir sinensis]|uniref:protocadherin Fat 3-like n=1 Tax=Eriocheir sinensis TaxID=95602 RepID=UPI0021C7F884|nr:protocadherin Fat 3-like [Eriocheir sinensis]